MTKRDTQAAEYAAESCAPPPHELGGRIAAALGIARCTSLTLKFNVGMLPVVEATMLPDPKALEGGWYEITQQRWALVPLDKTQDTSRAEDLHASIMAGRWHQRGPRWLRAWWLWFIGR